LTRSGHHSSDYSIVGAGEDRRRDGEAERLGGFEVDDELEARGLFDRQSASLSPASTLAPISPHER
jgi:hypothetical protein